MPQQLLSDAMSASANPSWMRPGDASPAAGAELPGRFSYRRLEASDVDEHAENLDAWEQSYDQLSFGRFRGTLYEAWIGDIQIFREVTTQAVVEEGKAWGGARTFGVPMAMDGAGTFCDQPLESADQIFSFGPGTGFSLRSPRMFDVVGIAVGDEAYQRAAESLEDHRPGAAGDRPGVMSCQEGLPRLRAFLSALFDVLESGSAAPLAHPQAQKTLGAALLGHIALAARGARDLPAPLPTYRTRKLILERAREYVLEHAHEAVTIGELCAVLRVSRRTLQYCFQDVLNTSPAQYLRTVRLNGVRRELRLGRACGTQVQDVAARWGFWHLSHFANDYRAMFGELPSETLRKDAPGQWLYC